MSAPEEFLVRVFVQPYDVNSNTQYEGEYWRLVEEFTVISDRRFFETLRNRDANYLGLYFNYSNIRRFRHNINGIRDIEINDNSIPKNAIVKFG